MYFHWQQSTRQQLQKRCTDINIKSDCGERNRKLIKAIRGSNTPLIEVREPYTTELLTAEAARARVLSIATTPKKIDRRVCMQIYKIQRSSEFAKHGVKVVFRDSCE